MPHPMQDVSAKGGAFCCLKSVDDMLLVFAYYSPMANDQPSRHKVILSFAYQNGWQCSFFDSDRKRTLLPRKAFFNSEETMAEFVRRSGGIKTLEDRNIFEMQLKRNFGDVTLNLTVEQYRELKKGK
jgi:hypothetical protein